MKTKTKMMIAPLALIAALSFAPNFAHAAKTPPPAAVAAASPEEAALQKRFKARYPQIQQFKSAGTIGETDTGEVDFVKQKDEKAAKVVEEENTDRKALYKLIADREGISADVVAQRAGKRNFDHAKPGDWLKDGGKWRQKAAAK
jgi:uncharacterized protein